MMENPIPQGKYVPATRTDNMVFTAGMTPRDNGVLIKSGKVKISEPIETYKQAVIQATTNALNAAKNMLSEDEKLSKILFLTVYVNAEEGFTSHAKIGDIASNFLYEKLGDAGIGSRAAIGVASLPGNAPVEIQLVAQISSRDGSFCF